METVNNKTENDLSRFRVTANDEIPMNDAILLQGDRRLISIGDISVITGQPKSRKTFLVSALCAAYLSETGYLGFTPGIKGKILLVDTEQSRPFVLNVIRRIYRILNWNFEDIHSEDIDVLSLRELSANERLVTLEKAIMEFKPKFVIVDGFADLLLDTNSLEESTKKVFDLMRFSTVYNCHICTVVHTNPNSEKMRGHTGSELQRKSETVLLVTKSEEISTVSPQFCRNVEFNKFSFRIDSNGLPVSCEYTPSPDDNNKILFESIFLVSPSFKYSDLKKEVMRRLSIKSTAAENRIKKALQADIIVKDNNSVYSLSVEDEENDVNN
jgi:hypothetical protein